MAVINASMVKELRDKTGAGMMDCKKALSENDGDMDKAVDFLRKKGIATAEKRSGRAMSEGTIQSYIHMGGKIAAMVEVGCETDFVAKNEDFQEFTRNIAMHVAATCPAGISQDDIPAEVIEKEMTIYRDQAREMGKPENILDKIAEGKLGKYFKENCLLNQDYVKNPELTIQDLLNELIAKMGENISIKRFARFQVGE
ncbi:MAG: translation elongation factor Ts [Desulfobacterales bacterium]|nr:translation elongation factor Ts [Desulfobacterales bacterium]